MKCMYPRAISSFYEMSTHKREIAPNEFLLFVFNESTTESITLAIPSSNERFVYAAGEDFFALRGSRDGALAPGEAILLFSGKQPTIAEILGKTVRPLRQTKKIIEIDPLQGDFVSATEYRWNGRDIERCPRTESQCKDRSKKFSGEVVRRVNIQLKEPQDIEVSMPRFRGAAAISINGVPAGSIIWPPKTLFISGKNLRAGENRIDLALCNTLANHMRSTDFLRRAEELELGVKPNIYYKMTETADRAMIARDSVA